MLTFSCLIKITMKPYILLFTALILATTVKAQSIFDGLRYATQSNYGTARFQSMSGAFGALGGDLSAIGVNPAGSAVFLKTSGSISFGINDIENRAVFQNNRTTSVDTNLNINQAGGVFVIDNPNENSVWKKFTISINYDAVNNYNNELYTRGTNRNSLANFFVTQANGIQLNQLETQGSQTVAGLYSLLGNSQGTTAQNALLGYQSFIIDPLDPTNSNNTSYISNVANGAVNQEYLLVSRGTNSKGTINLAAQVTNDLYFGVNLNTYSIDYRESTYLNESNNLNGSSITAIGFENNLVVFGFGFSAQLGAIAKLDNLRLGLTIDTPTWYSISEETSQSIETIRLESDIPITTFIDPNIINVFEEYYLRTPGKIAASAAYIFGKSGLLSIDYSYKDYSNLEFDNLNNSINIFQELNTRIENNLQGASSLKIGGEYRVQNISLRGGFQYVESPFKNDAVVGDTTGFSLGAGYAFSRYNFDISYARAQQDRTEQIFGLSETISNEVTINNIALTFGISF